MLLLSHLTYIEKSFSYWGSVSDSAKFKTWEIEEADLRSASSIISLVQVPIGLFGDFSHQFIKLIRIQASDNRPFHHPFAERIGGRLNLVGRPGLHTERFIRAN